MKNKILLTISMMFIAIMTLSSVAFAFDFGAGSSGPGLGVFGAGASGLGSFGAGASGPGVSAFGPGAYGPGVSTFGPGASGPSLGAFGPGAYGPGLGGFSAGASGPSLGAFGPGALGGSSSSGSFDSGSSFGGIGFIDGIPGAFDTGFPGPGAFPGIGPGPAGFPPVPGGEGGFPSEADARWQDLADVTIVQASPSGTLLQDNVFSKCSDPDDTELTFGIASSSHNFNLKFVDDDLRIYDLDRKFIGTEAVTLTCNGVGESFLLHVVPRGLTPPSDDDDNKRSGSGLSVHLGSIRIPMDSVAGDLIPVYITFKNNGHKKLENLKAAVVIQDLALRDSVGPLDLRVNKKETRAMYLQLTDDVQPGTYYARITIDSNSVHRVVHREFDVIV